MESTPDTSVPPSRELSPSRGRSRPEGGEGAHGGGSLFEGAEEAAAGAAAAGSSTDEEGEQGGGAEGRADAPPDVPPVEATGGGGEGGDDAATEAAPGEVEATAEAEGAADSEGSQGARGGMGAGIEPSDEAGGSAAPAAGGADPIAERVEDDAGRPGEDADPPDGDAGAGPPTLPPSRSASGRSSRPASSAVTWPPSPSLDLMGSTAAAVEAAGQPPGSALTEPTMPPSPSLEYTEPPRQAAARQESAARPEVATAARAPGSSPGAPRQAAEPTQVSAQDSGANLTASSSVPSMAMGGHTVSTLGRNRPLVMPFVERRNPVVEGRRAAAATAAALGPAAGRWSGPPGAIRLGPTHHQPQLPVSSSSASVTRESVARTRRSDITHSQSTIGTAATARTPAATGEGGDEELAPPPLHQTSSREWDKVPRGYAAGGGAAAVKAAVAASSSAKVLGASSADQLLQQQVMLGEAIRIKSIHKTGAAPGLDPPSISISGMGVAGVPGRRGRRVLSHPTSASATAAAMAAYFAGVEASIAEGTAHDKALLPSGLARRLKAARMMATGPPPFQRRRDRPPPPSPSGVKLDGFMLLEAADEEMPEAVQAASLESRHIGAVETADLTYFVALRNLDVSDNKLPDIVCLATLQALVRLRAASCRLHTLGRWPGSLVTEGGHAAEGGETVRPPGGPGVLKRLKTRAAAAAAAAAATASGEAGSAEGTAPVTESGEGYEAWTVVAEDSGGARSLGGAGGEAAGDGAGAPPVLSAEASAASDVATAALVAALLGPSAPNPFQYLEVLDLSYNQLQPHMVLLPGSPLATLPRLVELDLSSNHLKHLPAPAEITAAAAKAAAAAVARAAAAGDNGAPVASVAFPALRRLRLADNGLKGGALASLAALAPPSLLHLDLSHNAISEAPRLKFLADNQGSALQLSYSQTEDQQQYDRFATVLTRLAVLDLTYNKIATEAAVGGLLHLPALQRLLLAGNPIVVAVQRPHARAGGLTSSLSASKVDFGEPHAAPAKPTVAASLTGRFARITEAAPKQQASNLAAAAAVITHSVATERVTEAFDRMDATIEQWRLNTVMEEDEEEDEEEGEAGAEDHTFLTGVAIQERRRKGSAATAEGGDEGLEEGHDEPLPPPPPDSQAVEERPLWESISDPTERLAVALGLDPITLPMHTGALTIDSAGAIAALRFTLAHPLVEADDGLAPHPRYLAPTTAAQLKRKPRRPVQSQRLAPMGAAAPAAEASGIAHHHHAAGSPKAAKLQTVEAMLDGMKGKLAMLEASLAAQLAAAPAPPTVEAVRNAVASSKGRYGMRRPGMGHESDSDEGEDDANSTGSGLPDDVIDQIERESESEADDERALEGEMAPMDPKEGLVLMADALMADEAAVDTGASNVNGPSSYEATQSPSRGLGASQPSRSAVTMSSSPPAMHQQSPPRTSGSPQRLGTAASAGGGAISRKTVVTGGGTSLPPSPLLALPGGAASALGYAR